MYDIMLDLETLGTDTDAVVTSIGAVKFNRETFEIVAHFKENLNIEEQEEVARAISGRTVLWWMKQPQETALRMTENPVHVDAALMAFVRLVGDDTKSIWGNGSDFDNMILGSLYEDFGIRKPWSYSQNRCFRTLKREFPVEPPTREGVHHDALDDAVYQLAWLKKIKESLKHESI